MEGSEEPGEPGLEACALPTYDVQVPAAGLPPSFAWTLTMERVKRSIGARKLDKDAAQTRCSRILQLAQCCGRSLSTSLKLSESDQT